MSDAYEQSVSLRPSRSQRVISPVLRVSLLLGVAVHLVGFLIFKVRSNPLPSRGDPSAYVEYVSQGHMSEDTELQEKAMLFDSAPLFIPTPWNVAAQAYETHLTVGNWTFPYLEPEINLVEALQPSVGLVLDVDEVNEPMDLLASAHWSFFDGFVGESDSVEPFPDPKPFAEVRVVGSSRLERMPIEGLTFEGQRVRNPVTYWMRVSSGMTQALDPLLGNSSGSRLFDESVLAWLKRPMTQVRLPDGYLFITVYPE